MVRLKIIKSYLGELLIRNNLKIKNKIIFNNDSIDKYIKFHIMIKPPKHFIQECDLINEIDICENELIFHGYGKNNIKASFLYENIYYAEIYENNMLLNINCLGKYFLFAFEFEKINPIVVTTINEKIYKAKFQTRKGIEEEFECFYYSCKEIKEDKVKIKFNERVMEIWKEKEKIKTLSKINLIQSNSQNDFDILINESEYININCLMRVEKNKLIKIIKFFNKNLIHVYFDLQRRRLTEGDIGNKYFNGYIFSNEKIKQEMKPSKFKNLHSFVFEDGELVVSPLEKYFIKKGKVRKFDYRNIVNLFENDVSGLIEITLKKPIPKCSSLRYGFKIQQEKPRFLNLLRKKY